MSLLKSGVGRLRVAGYLEGVSFLVLLGIAMPLKYLAGRPEAVRIVGMAHGILFLVYVALVLAAWREQRWPGRILGWLLLAALLPGGPFVADRRVLRKTVPG
jgi:integral membrane protein